MANDAPKPLSHLTVVDLTVNVPGPFCSMVLADLGARVIKVEPPDGDPLRHSPRMWASVNRGKESICLDLKTPEGRAVLSGLGERADIVLEGWRPGVANRLGADYPALSSRNPGLVYCSISGFGQEGPWRDRPAHDVNYLSLSGYMGVQTAVEGRPWPPAILVSDLSAGLYAAISTLAAVTGRQASGKGAYIDLSMAESAVALLGMEFARAGEENDGHPNVTHVPHYGLFPCSDGKWISLGIVHEDHFWESFCRASGLDDMAGLRFEERLAQGGMIVEALQRVFPTRTSTEWEQRLDEADVPAAVVMDLDEVYRSPQFRARGLFAEIEGLRYVSQPAQFSTGSVAPTREPPEAGQHTAAILSELGYDEEQVTRLWDSNVFGRVKERAAR